MMRVATMLAGVVLATTLAAPAYAEEVDATVSCQSLVDEWIGFAAALDERARSSEARNEALTFRLDQKRNQIDRLKAKVERLREGLHAQRAR